MFVLSPGSTKRNGEVFISAHPLYTLLSPFPSACRFSLPISPSLSLFVRLSYYYPASHSTSKSIRSAAKPLFPLLSRKLSDALSRTTYMSTPSSPTEDFDSCLIHVSHTVTWIRRFPRVRFPAGGS